MATNAASLVNFGTTGPVVGEFVYSIGPLTAPSYLPADLATTSYLTASYPALSALINTPATTLTYTTPTITNTNWPAIAYGNSTFVAVTQGPNNRSATTPDGTTWTERVNLPVSGNWLCIAYGASVFVTCNYGTTTAATSPDGVTWTSRTLPSASNWYGVAFGNGVFVAVAGGPSTVAATSPDGITWTARTLPSSQQWGQIVFGNGIFFALPFDGGVYATSSDGITWTQRATPSSITGVTVAFGNGKFVLLSGTDYKATAATSTDAISWTTKPIGVTIPYLTQMTYGNGLYVGVRGSASGVYTYTSANGLDWIPWVTNVPYIQAIAYGPTGVFVAVQGGGGSLALRLTPTTSASSFQIPVIAPITGTTAYVKAT